jgi:hypothetical protein
VNTIIGVDAEIDTKTVLIIDKATLYLSAYRKIDGIPKNIAKIIIKIYTLRMLRRIFREPITSICNIHRANIIALAISLWLYAAITVKVIKINSSDRGVTYGNT